MSVHPLTAAGSYRTLRCDYSLHVLISVASKDCDVSIIIIIFFCAPDKQS